MVRLLVVGCLLAGLVLAVPGCGDSEPSGSGAKTVEEIEALEEELAQEQGGTQGNGESSKPQAKKQAPARAAGFSGKSKEGYEIAVFICANYPLERIAKELGLPASAEPSEVAETYADAYWGQFRQAAFEGCFEGIMKRLGG